MTLGFVTTVTVYGSQNLLLSKVEKDPFIGQIVLNHYKFHVADCSFS